MFGYFPFHIDLAIGMAIAAVVLFTVSMIWDAVRKARTQRRASFIRSVRNHPAGRHVGLTETAPRHRAETPAFDWINGDL